MPAVRLPLADSRATIRAICDSIRPQPDGAGSGHLVVPSLSQLSVGAIQALIFAAYGGHPNARVSRDDAGRDLISEQEMLAELHAREEI